MPVPASAESGVARPIAQRLPSMPTERGFSVTRLAGTSTSRLPTTMTSTLPRAPAAAGAASTAAARRMSASRLT
jgi:hypothetical protein